MPGGREGDHSAADVERLRGAYRALGESGVSALAHVLGDELRWLAPSSVMPTTLSRNDLLARLVDLGWDRLHFEPHDFAVSGRRIVATVRETRKDGEGSFTGRRGHYWEMSDAGAVRLRCTSGRSTRLARPTATSRSWRTCISGCGRATTRRSVCTQAARWRVRGPARELSGSTRSR